MGLFLAPLKNDLPGDKFRYQYEGLPCHLQTSPSKAVLCHKWSTTYKITSDNPVGSSLMFQMGDQGSQKNEANIGLS